MARSVADMLDAFAGEILGSPALPLPILLLRLFGAVLLCALIGYEREASARAAGLRTNMIVGLAAACYAVVTFEMVGIYARQAGDQSVRMDPLRLVEATTAGVAFLAAGMIVLSRGRVKNLTTGALLWLSAAIGLAAGNGLWRVAVLAALLGLAIGLLRDPPIAKEDK